MGECHDEAFHFLLTLSLIQGTVSAQDTQVDFGISITDVELRNFYLAVSSQYHVPGKEVVAVILISPLQWENFENLHKDPQSEAFLKKWGRFGRQVICCPAYTLLYRYFYIFYS